MNALKLSLPSDYAVIGYLKRSNGEEVVAVSLNDNKCTPFATYQLAPPDRFEEVGRGCMWGDYLKTRQEAIQSLVERAQ